MRYKDTGHRFCEEINDFCEKAKLRCALVTGGGYAYDSIKYLDDEVPNKDFDFMIVYEDERDIKIIISNLKFKTKFLFEDKFLENDIRQLEERKIDIIRLSGKYRKFKATINFVPISLIRKISFLQEDKIRKIAHGRNTSLFFAYGTSGNRITTIFFSPFFKTQDGDLHYIHLDFTCKKHQKHLFLGILSDAILKGYSKQYDNVGFHVLRVNLIKNIYTYLLKRGIENYQYETLFANWSYFSDSVKVTLIKEFCEINQTVRKTYSFSKENYKTYFLLDEGYKINCSPFDFVKCKKLSSTLKKYIFSMQNSEYTRQYLIDAWGKFLAAVYYERGSDYKKVNLHLKQYDWDKEIDKYFIYGVNDIYYNSVDGVSYESLLYFLKWIFQEQINLNYEFIKCIINITIDYFEMILKIDLVKLDEFWNDQEIDFLIRFSQRKIICEYIDAESFEEIAMLHNIHSEAMEKYTEEEGGFLSKYFVDKQGAILDVMCGVGRIANQLRKMQYDNIYGIDQYDYTKLDMEKNFNFIKSKMEDFSTNMRFKYVVCLYNCYANTDELCKVLDKIYEISQKDVIVVIDIFNKKWRDKMNAQCRQVLKKSEDYIIELIREYTSPIEKTIYNVLKNGKVINTYTLQQSFFEEEDLRKVFLEKWEFKLVNSKEVNTRNNDQKLIYIMTKK